MSRSGESLTEKQRRLSADIARQRTEFTQAYRNIEKPIFYTQQAMRGFGFLRQNPWVLSVVPATFSIVSSLVGMIRNKPGKVLPRRGGWLARDAERDMERGAERKSKSLAGHLVKWGGHGWKLFGLYRRLRKYFL